MNRVVLTLSDELYRRLSWRAAAEEKTPDEIAVERLRREFGEVCLDSQTAKEKAATFLRKRAGRCLTVREPVLEETDTPIWLVPVITNVAPHEAAFVGQIMVNAKTGNLLNTERDIVEMIQKGYRSLGFRRFPLEKQERLSELLAENRQGPLAADKSREMENLLAEEQALQIANLEALQKRLLPED